jgi:CheY-like chemotaxis protein
LGLYSGWRIFLQKSGFFRQCARTAGILPVRAAPYDRTVVCPQFYHKKKIKYIIFWVFNSVAFCLQVCYNQFIEKKFKGDAAIMDKPLTVLLVEDEPIECTLFVQAVEAMPDVHLIGVTNNADKALELSIDFLPDAIILDLELHKGSGNGVMFLRELNKGQSPTPPYILVTTNNISRVTHEQVRQLGADFVMLKNQPDYSAESVIEFLHSLKNIIHNTRERRPPAVSMEALPPAEKRKRIAARVASEIDLIGVSPKAKGRDYLIDAILLLIDGQGNHISALAQSHNKTVPSVERAMQNAIKRAWQTNDIEDLQRFYTARIGSEKGVPTLTEFVCFYANKMKKEYKIREAVTTAT